MKCLKYMAVLFTFFFCINNVNAKGINYIEMNISILDNGDASVVEVWDAYPTEKTEYYHAYNNIGNSKITDLKVKDESGEYSFTNWNVNASLDDKAHKYGYNYTTNGVELCFGKSSYSHHTYTITYKITNFVSRVSDADIVYWKLFDSITPTPSKIDITISSSIPFRDNSNVWGYGNNGGLAYVIDGKAHLSNYTSVLIKFPLNSFNTANYAGGDFNYYYNMANNNFKQGETNYTVSTSNKEERSYSIFSPLIFYCVLICLISAFTPFIQRMTAPKKKSKYKLRFNTKKLSSLEFKDIPHNNDLFRAYWLAHNYNILSNKTDFFGALLLRWQIEDKIKINKGENGAFILLSPKESFVGNLPETRLYGYLYDASKDGVLESSEFGSWCRVYHDKILDWFILALDYETEMLIKEGKINVISSWGKNYAVDDSMLEEANELNGLKNYFKEFQNIQDKSSIDVEIWGEYLVYAQLLGVANEVSSDFSSLYPGFISDNAYDSFEYIQKIALNSI